MRPPRSLSPEPDGGLARRAPGAPCDPERNAWAGRTDLSRCRKPLAFVGAVHDDVSPSERAVRLAMLEAVAEDLASGTGDAELDALLTVVRHRLAALALRGGA